MQERLYLRQSTQRHSMFHVFIKNVLVFLFLFYEQSVNSYVNLFLEVIVYGNLYNGITIRIKIIQT